MGQPNSQPARSAAEILRDMVRSPERRMSEEDAHSVGVDIDLLEAMYESEIRPFLDHLSGYKGLAELDPQNRTYVIPGRESWNDVLGRHGLVGKHSQVLEVFSTTWYCFSPSWNGPNYTLTTIYLTRKGSWLLYTAESGEEEFQRGQDTKLNESIRQLDSVRGLCVAVSEKVTANHSRTKSHSEPSFLPLGIELRLRNILARTIELREQRIASMQKALENANRRVSGVVPRR